MANKKGWREFTETEFKQMKMLQSQGKNTMDLAQIFGRSTSTTSFVSRSETFEDYGELVRTVKKTARSYPKNRKKFASVIPQETPISSVVIDVADLSKKMDKVIELLGEQKAIIDRIPKRRKF